MSKRDCVCETCHEELERCGLMRIAASFRVERLVVNHTKKELESCGLMIDVVSFRSG